MLVHISSCSSNCSSFPYTHHICIPINLNPRSGPQTVDLEHGSLGVGPLPSPPIPHGTQQRQHHQNPYQSQHQPSQHHRSAGLNDITFAPIVAVPLTPLLAAGQVAQTAAGTAAAVAAAAAVTAATASVEAQLLPGHLKCGMWASLALATVFVAGAKLLITLDQQVQQRCACAGVC